MTSSAASKTARNWASDDIRLALLKDSFREVCLVNVSNVERPAAFNHVASEFLGVLTYA